MCSPVLYNNMHISKRYELEEEMSCEEEKNQRDAKYIWRRRRRVLTVVVQCNYCQEEETLLLCSPRMGVGPVQARYTSTRLRPSAHVRTGDRKKAMGP